MAADEASRGVEYMCVEGSSLPVDVLPQVLLLLTSLEDLCAAAGTCRLWRQAAQASAQLRSWNYDDDLYQTPLPGTTATSLPMLPKTPPPKQWVNPSTYSPLASHKTPASLALLEAQDSRVVTPLAIPARLGHYQMGLEASPRTPSPILERGSPRPLASVVRRQMAKGAYIGDVDLRSSRLDNNIVQLLLKSCPKLHTLRLQHICASQRFPPVRTPPERRSLLFSLPPTPSPTSSPRDAREEAPGAVHFCGCSALTSEAFLEVAEYCPNLGSLTLLLQHVAFSSQVRKLFAIIGQLPRLTTLAVELRMPSFGHSMKAEADWEEQCQCTDKELDALLQGGPPPLEALALNRCDITPGVVKRLVAACPQLQALELHSDLASTVSHQGSSGLNPSIVPKLQLLNNLTAAAMGIFYNVEGCDFATWRMPGLRRLRLELRGTMSADQLLALRRACPRLDSLHMVWDNREAHICPVSEKALLNFISDL